MARADPTATRRKREAAGRCAKTAAALWLQLKGHRILDRRARMPACEVALVARKGRMLVFFGVKARRHGLQQHLRRFDIVMLAPGKLRRQMRDAWPAQG